MTLEPLPRRVGPISGPLFSPTRRSRRRRLHSDRPCRGPGGPRRGVAAADRGGRSAARVGSDDGKSGTADRAMAGPATARLRRTHRTPFMTARGSGPRPAAPIRATARAEGRFEHGPLGVGQVHAVEYDGDPTDVSGCFRIDETASVAETRIRGVLA